MEKWNEKIIRKRNINNNSKRNVKNNSKRNENKMESKKESKRSETKIKINNKNYQIFWLSYFRLFKLPNNE